MRLQVLEPEFSICKVEDITQIHFEDEFLFLGKTDEELSLVCLTERVPQNVLTEDPGWRGFRVEGPLDFSLVGILSDIAGVLAERGISIFAVSTFQTDYILVKKEKLDAAMKALGSAGFQ